MLREKKHYIAVVKKSKSTNYQVIFPDFPSCITAGRSFAEAAEFAYEALQFHIDGMVEDKEEIPNASTLDAIKKKYKKAEAFLMIEAKIPTKSVRINITVDEKFLRKLDKYLEKHDGNRSLFFVEAAQQMAGF